MYPIISFSPHVHGNHFILEDLSLCLPNFFSRNPLVVCHNSFRVTFSPPGLVSNFKRSVGLILGKVSQMRVSIPLDLSTRPFVPLPHFLRSHRPPPPRPKFPRPFSFVLWLTDTWIVTWCTPMFDLQTSLVIIVLEWHFLPRSLG